MLLISEELDEIFEMSDRVAVLCDGKLMGIRNTAETDYEEIGADDVRGVCVNPGGNVKGEEDEDRNTSI